ncbi:MAG: FliA/WhiG family RNA polymerase sigma factor [Desulfohalobiaceae bacterium]
MVSKLNQGELNWSELDLRTKEAVVRGLGQKVKIIAWRLKAKLPKHVDVNDLLSAGSLGLLESLSKFDFQLGVSLETYVEGRIRGAMLDELRKQDWFSRGLRQQMRQVEKARQDLEQSKGASPSREELEQATGLGPGEVEQALGALQQQIWLSLENANPGLAELRRSGQDEDEPYQKTLRQELVQQLSHLIQELTEKEQLVLSLYYEQELTMKETAEVLQITEGRVSQLHSQALGKLRRMFREQGSEPESDQT